MLLDSLEEIIESFKYEGGLSLAEDYIDLEEKLRDRLDTFDGRPRPERDV